MHHIGLNVMNNVQQITEKPTRTYIQYTEIQISLLIHSITY